MMPATQVQFQVKNPFSPKESLEAGSKLLRDLLDRYHGNLSLALSAYNAGGTTFANLGPTNSELAKNVQTNVKGFHVNGTLVLQTPVANVPILRRYFPALSGCEFG